MTLLDGVLWVEVDDRHWEGSSGQVLVGVVSWEDGYALRSTGGEVRGTHSTLDSAKAQLEGWIRWLDSTSTRPPGASQAPAPAMTRRWTSRPSAPPSSATRCSWSRASGGIVAIASVGTYGAFATTAAYEAAIARWFADRETFPETLIPAFVKERDCMTKAVRDDILDICQKTMRLEDAFIDLAFEMGPVPGMTPREIKKYIRYIADWRLGQLGLTPIYMVDEHPLPWLAPLLNGVEHANFFETRATEYSKAATRGNWNEVWDNFDRRQKAKAKAANESGAEASAVGEGEGGPDMFSAAGVAAE